MLYCTECVYVQALHCTAVLLSLFLLHEILTIWPVSPLYFFPQAFPLVTTILLTAFRCSSAMKSAACHLTGVDLWHTCSFPSSPCPNLSASCALGSARSDPGLLSHSWLLALPLRVHIVGWHILGDTHTCPISLTPLPGYCSRIMGGSYSTRYAMEKHRARDGGSSTDFLLAS